MGQSSNVSNPSALSGDELGRKWSVSLVAFGPPSHPRTSSGFSRNLAEALRRHGHLRREFSVKRLNLLDIGRGAMGIRLGLNGEPAGPYVRRAWMWSHKGSELLSRRLEKRLVASGDRGAFLQVGTLVQIDPSFGRHFMRTDMTICQARRAGHFAVGSMSPRALCEAEKLQQENLASAAGILAASQWTADSLVQDCGVPPQRITVIYTGGASATASASIRTREILFVGTDWERKGGPLLLEALRLVRRRLPDATLRIVGCRPRVREPGVTVEGFLDRRYPAQRQRLEACYERAGCFCLPSLFDPFPNAVIEASNVGLPTVSLDTGSRSEAVLHGRTGALAPVPSAEALAEALYDVLHDLDRCRGMGDAARNFARGRFTWDRVIERIASAIAPPQSPDPVFADSARDMAGVVAAPLENRA